METRDLVGKTIVAVACCPLLEMNAAWVTALTPAVCTYVVFLELAGGDVVVVSPCEVALDGERYPALGLSLDICDRSEMLVPPRDGIAPEVIALGIAGPLLPLEVERCVESDLHGEGVVSQIRIEGTSSGALVLRHIMPPMTLGVIVE